MFRLCRVYEKSSDFQQLSSFSFQFAFVLRILPSRNFSLRSFRYDLFYLILRTYFHLCRSSLYILINIVSKNIPKRNSGYFIFFSSQVSGPWRLQEYNIDGFLRLVVAQRETKVFVQKEVRIVECIFSLRRFFSLNTSSRMYTRWTMASQRQLGRSTMA